MGVKPFALGSFIGPNVIVPQGGPLLIPNDAALTQLGFRQFLDFNGGTLKTTGNLVTSRTILLLAGGGAINTNGFGASFSGDIINSGSLTKIGTGTLTLSGNNTYMGGTIIAGGVLRVSSDGNLGTGKININNSAELLTTGSSSSSKAIVLGNGGGILASAPGATAAYGGVISGSGRLSIGETINNGTIVLSALNTYTGGTTISAGTLQLGNGGTTGIIFGNVTDNGSLSVNRSDTVSFNSTISGLGNLVQNGSGSTVLGGMNTYTGGTIINNGTFLVNSSQALGLGDVVVNGGALKTDPQPINVKGNYTQNAGGTLQLGIMGSAPGQYGFLDVNGRAILVGTLQLYEISFFGSQHPVIQSGGTIRRNSRRVDWFQLILYDTRRAALGGTATGSTDGGEFDGYIGGGYELHYGRFTFGPVAALQYTYVDISRNSESGSLAPLQINAKSADSLRTNLGCERLLHCHRGKVKVTPSLRATWQHEYLYSSLPITAQFAGGAGNAFTVTGPAEGHDSALINTGITCNGPQQLELILATTAKWAGAATTPREAFAMCISILRNGAGGTSGNIPVISGTGH